jgi:hypothetical protein
MHTVYTYKCTVLANPTNDRCYNEAADTHTQTHTLNPAQKA